MAALVAAGVGQEVAYYIAELRKRKYNQALLVLPHDGNSHHGPISKTYYKDHFQDAGFEVDVIPNQGPGAAMLRIEAARRVSRFDFETDAVRSRQTP